MSLSSYSLSANEENMDKHHGSFSYKLSNAGDHRFQNVLAGNNPPHYIRIFRVSIDSPLLKLVI